MSVILKIEKLAKRYGTTEVLRDISLTMEQGEFLVFIGPSGSGKSTLLSCIAGLNEVSEGTIHIGGRDMTDIAAGKRDIAMVFQSYALFPTMTVAGNITFGMRVRGVDKSTRHQKLLAVTKNLKMEHLLNRRPSELSGGQRQRVAMARALVRDPQIFLFDEPLSNLDAKLRVSMRSEIKRIHKKLGASMVYVTHDQVEAMTLATRIVVLNEGIIQQIGPPGELYNRPANIFVADFMGSPAMNLLRARVCRRERGLEIIVQRGAKGSFTLLDHRPPKSLDTARDTELIFGIRPEAVAYKPHLKDPDNTVLLEVEQVALTGADTFIEIDCGNTMLMARLAGDTTIGPADEVPFSFNMDKVSYFHKKDGTRFL